MNYTVLDVNEGTEKREAEAYIAAYAKGGVIASRSPAELRPSTRRSSSARKADAARGAGRAASGSGFGRRREADMKARRTAGRRSVLALALLSIAVAPGQAAPRRGAAQVAQPSLPEIRTSERNQVPACVTPERLMRF